MNGLQVHMVIQKIVTWLLGLPNLEQSLIDDCNALLAYLAQDEESSTRTKANPNTGPLAGAFEILVEAFDHLKSAITNRATMRYDANTLAQGKALLDILNKQSHDSRQRTTIDKDTKVKHVGSMSRVEYLSMIENLLAELSIPANAAIITQLGLDAALKYLRDCETAYSSIHTQKIHHDAQRSLLPYKGTIWAKLCKNGTELIDDFNRKYADSNDAAYISVAEQINKLAASETAVARLRKTDAAKRKKNKPTPPPASPVLPPAL